MEAKDTVKLCGDEHCQPYCHKAQAEISFKAGKRNILDILRKINVRAWEDVLVYVGGGKPN